MNWSKVVEVLRERADVANGNAQRLLSNEVFYQALKSEYRTLTNLADALEAGITDAINAEDGN